MKNTIISLILLAGVAQADDASLNTYTYEVRVPATGANCAQAAVALATQLTRFSTTVRSTAGECVQAVTLTEDGTNYTLFDLSVKYQAAEPILPFTVTFSPSVVEQQTSIYTSYKDCLADLPNQVSIFQSATGLTAAAAFCVDRSDDISSAYDLSIQAFGDSPVALRTFENAADWSLSHTTGWLDLILTQIKSQGNIVAKVLGESVYYYSQNLANISAGTFVQTKQLDECNQQLDEAKLFLGRAGGKSVNVFCHTDTDGSVTLDYIADTESSEFFGNDDSTVYYSFAECLTHRDQLESSAALNPYWYGAFCQPDVLDESHYKLTQYSEP